MRNALVRTLRELREAADISQAAVAAHLSRDQYFISRFEGLPNSGNDRWPHNMDAIVKAYASELETPVPGLWAQAIAVWGRADGYEAAVNFFEEKKTTGETVVVNIETRLEELTTVVGALADQIQVLVEDAQERREKMTALIRAATE